jgi:hypothetical protein
LKGLRSAVFTELVPEAPRFKKKSWSASSNLKPQTSAKGATQTSAEGATQTSTKGAEQNYEI